MSEYVSSNFCRRAFISGFTGSAGTAVVLQDKALMWTDGRYFLQAEKEMDENWSLMKAFMPGTPSKEEYLSSNLEKSSKVGIDPKTCSVQLFKTLNKQLRSAGMELVPVADNLIDKVWDDAPPAPSAPVFVHDIKYAGESASSKMETLRKKIKEKQCSAIVLSALDDIAWLYNLRGSDVNYNPVFYSFAIVTPDSSTLFVDEGRVGEEVRSSLTETSTKIQPYNAVYSSVKELTDRVFLPLSTNAAIAQAIPAEQWCVGMSPVQEMKAIKNEVELQGMRDCHVRDGAALCQYLHWLETTDRELDEVDGADQAELFRSKQDMYVSLSFDTISSSGPNGAVIHYKPEKGSCRKIDKTMMYLCDSGAQYRDGTTDVTRTVHMGTPTQQQKMCFTRVLQGHIDLAMAVFPPGTKGTCLDCLARRPLWNVGLNYQHGTGHGVGSFLNVHEGPCRIAAGSRMSKHEMGLQKGMILSDEPGYYEAGEYGIRIESLVEVVECKDIGPADGRFLTFQPVTMAPIDLRLVDRELMSQDQIAWLNEYHGTVREKVMELWEKQGQSEDLKKWLEHQTREI
eukprot:sb/3463478/